MISKAGLGSRTDARKWIGAGRVRVNGKLVQTPDHWVDPERDRITLDDKALRAQKRLYLLLYKPKGYITTYRDPQGRPTVYDLIQDVPQFVSPVGRLDLDTSGLLLMTNDTQLAERIMNPDHKVPKTYLVKCAGILVGRADRATARGSRVGRRSNAARRGYAFARVSPKHLSRDHDH